MSFKINEQPNVFDDHFLDVIGNEFKFDHVKGLAEWLKNSADAYTRNEIPDDEQFIFLRFSPKTDDKLLSFECIDFVGMSKKDIDAAFKRWGDPTAAARGTGRRMLGGHGNGGKFYMRQMFKRSQFITYRNGKLNVFGFNDRKRYGYADGYENKSVPGAEALNFAKIEGLAVPKKVRERWAKDGICFTVVIGEGPEKLRMGSQINAICQKLKVHPQSRRLVKHKEIFILSQEDAQGRQLLPDEIPPRPEFEGPFKIALPKELEFDGEKFQFTNSKNPEAYLTLFTSAEPFGRMGERSALNTIDILGEVGCIGSYRLNELGYLRYSAQAEFICGECYCPILEDPSDDCVRNDREKLVETEKTKALLTWIRDKVDELCEKMAEKDRNERKQADLRQSSEFNELLNRWKNKFMSKVFSEVLGGGGQGDSFGGLGGGNEGSIFKDGKGKGTGDTVRPDSGGNNNGDGGGGSGMEPKKAPRFPRVLLSGHDSDPLNTESNMSVDLDPRHPPIHQRPEDVSEGIYWINTSRPLAQRIIGQYGVKSTRWREYLFQRYVDIIIKESLYQKAKKEPILTAEMVDDLIMNVISHVHDGAAEDLEQFLFEESFDQGASTDHAQE